MELTIHSSAYLSWATESGVRDDVVEAIMDDFDVPLSADGKKFTILAAVYECEYYFGNAFVLLQDPTTGELFEVNGSHCSCDGLGGQWRPEPTTFRALQERAGFAYSGDAKLKEAVLEAVWAATSGGYPQGAA